MENPHSAKGSVGADELRATVALAIPVVLVQLGFMAMGVVDTLMVGQVSARVLAAVALGNLYFFNVTILATGSLMALDPIVAQAAGAGETESIARALQRGVIIALGFTVACALLIAPAPAVLSALHQPPEIVGDASAYLRISLAGILPYLVFVVLRQSLQAMHRVAPIVWTVIVANLSNAGFNWVFVYGHLGSPALGVSGSAIATSISRWLMLLLLLAGAWRELRPLMLPVRDRIGALGPLSQMLRVGLPIGGQQGLEAGAFGAIGLLMGVLGTTEMAAHQVAITLAAFTFMVPLGVGSATAVRVGRAIGAGDMPRARAAIRASYVCGVGFMALTAVAFIAVPHVFAARLHARRAGHRARVDAHSDRRRVSGVRRRASGWRGRAARRRRHEGAARHHAHQLLARRRSGERVSRIPHVARRGRTVVGIRRVVGRRGDFSILANPCRLRAGVGRLREA